jgi:hypothetical protein
MKVQDFDLPELCQIGPEKLPFVYAVTSRGGFAAKAHVCFTELWLVGGVGRPVSRLALVARVQTDVETHSSGERGVARTAGGVG